MDVFFIILCCFLSSFVIIMYGKVTIFSFSKMVVVGLAKELFVSLKLDRNASERAHASAARACSSLAVS